MRLLSSIKHLACRVFAPGAHVHQKYRAFKSLLQDDNLAHVLMARLERYYHEDSHVDFCAVVKTYDLLSQALYRMVGNLDAMAPLSYGKLMDVLHGIDSMARPVLAMRRWNGLPPYVALFGEIPADAERVVGGKAANLCTLFAGLRLPVPRGFAVTSRAFDHFCECNRLHAAIDAGLADLDINSTKSLRNTSQRLVDAIMGSNLPQAVEEAIVAGYDQVFSDGAPGVAVSMRSSAVGEDTALSFAGQYRSVLNVGRDRLGEAYKRVVASKYSPMALHYRVRNGLLDAETPMAALVLEMIDAEASGIVYSRDPVASLVDSVMVYSIWGLGESLVKGAVAPDRIEIAREEGLPVRRKEAATKSRKTVLTGSHGVATVAVGSADRERLSLDEESARRLAAWSLELESFFQCPQDVEWCKDRDGRLYVLQSRPLRTTAAEELSCAVQFDEIPNRVLLSGGETAAMGVAAGRVSVVTFGSDLRQVPDGAVLVAATASPKLAQIMDKLQAVVTDVGSAAGHFASVARESNVPTLVNTRVATQVLVPGASVTVDATRRRVFAGVVEQLLSPACARSKTHEGSPFRQRLRRLLDCVSPLNRVDPRQPDFLPENCRTLHDILRFTHEKAIAEMFSLGGGGKRTFRGSKKLVSDIPIALHVLDLGNGLRKVAKRRRQISLDDIENSLLQALWRGLSHPGIVWSSGLRHLDWKEFDRVSAGIMGLDSQLLASFALISADYLNVNIRFGYHFAVVDALCGDVERASYISLQFEGGGGGFQGRRLRILFLARVLARHGFEVRYDEETLGASLQKVSATVLKEKLEVVGRLLGFTRLLDIKLRDEAEVDKLAADFVK